MKKIEKYELIVHSDVDKFNDIVNNRIKDGYELYGNHTSTVVRGVDLIYWQYIQAVVLYSNDVEVLNG